MNAGQIAAVGSPHQAKAGIKDSVELFKNDMLAAGVNLNHPSLLDKMIQESWKTVDWTQKEFGIKYRDRLTQMGGHSVPRTLSTINHSGRDIIDPMLRKIENMPGISLELNTAFHSFVVQHGDKESGHDEVVGIKVISQANETPQEVLCNKGVVVANGGFSADIDFRRVSAYLLISDINIWFGCFFTISNLVHADSSTHF